VVLKILITGGYGFIGSHVADKFFQKGHAIYIIDNLSTGQKDNVNINHKFYNLNTADKECEKIFSSNKIDIVIHLSTQIDLSKPPEYRHSYKEANFTGLVNMLNLSEKYRVKKFIIISPASIYGNAGNVSELPFNEDVKPNPVTPAGMSSVVKEYYTNKWGEIFNLKILSVRVSNLYGLRENLIGEPGVILTFINNILKGKNITINGYGTQTRDFLYIEDLADGLYDAAIDDQCNGVINISGNTECSINDLASVLTKLFEAKKIAYDNRIKNLINLSRLDNSKIKKLTGWEPKYNLEEGLKKTYEWYQKKLFAAAAKANPLKRAVNALKRVPKEFIAYLENILFFSLAGFIQYNHLFLGTYAFKLDIDYILLYVALIGILWGQKQAYLAMILSTALYTSATLFSGTDIITFIYTPEYLLHISAYILIGIITGYSIEKRNRDLESKDLALKSLGGKYDFLNGIYNETKIVKDQLQNQIIDTEDSFGVIYSIIQELDSLEIEKVFSAAITAIERIMKTDQISIYTVSDIGKGEFLRLKTRSPLLSEKIPNSIRVIEYKPTKEIMETKNLYINRRLEPDFPVMMAPVLEDRNVIAIVSIHKVPFENLTLHYENLFRTIIGLISNALKRAYFFEASLRDKRYIVNTRILNSNTFEKILEEVKKKKSELGMSYSLLEITDTDKSYQEISDSIINSIRDNDYLGLSKKGHIYILLSNTQSSLASLVVERLLKNGVKSTVMHEVLDDL